MSNETSHRFGVRPGLIQCLIQYLTLRDDIACRLARKIEVYRHLVGKPSRSVTQILNIEDVGSERGCKHLCSVKMRPHRLKVLAGNLLEIVQKKISPRLHG